MRPTSDRAAERWLVRRAEFRRRLGRVPRGRPSIEETALALEALAGTEHVAATRTRHGVARRARRSRQLGATPAPIGFYFAKLWYYERLYPLIFATGALGRVSALGNLALEPALAANPAS